MAKGLPLVVGRTAFQLAQKFIGVTELAGDEDNPRIMAWLKRVAAWPTHDEVPWCSAFCCEIAWLLDLPQPNDLRARSWLGVGIPIELSAARPGFDVVILNRGGPPDPDAEGPGHVGFYAGLDADRLLLLSGNQSNQVKVSPYRIDDLLGVRRLLW